MSDSNVVPFGKYKGQPVEVMMADAGYRDWMMAQPWFREKFRDLYQVIVNYNGEPAETPEHNAMQAAFLDDEWCLSLTLLFGRRLEDLVPLDERWVNYVTVNERDRTIGYRAFEVDGWDVKFTMEPAGFELELEDLPACTCVCDHEGCSGSAACRGGDGYCTHARHDDERKMAPSAGSHHCVKSCAWNAVAPTRYRSGHGYYRSNDMLSWLREKPWIPRERRREFLVELKPDLGDDFPAVLRQVLRYDGDGCRVVVVRRYAFEKVTWEQVAKMCAASNVYLVLEEWLKKETTP